MNCQSAKEQITDMLAAGSVELTRDLTGHVQSCPGCGTFYARQAEMFRAMESGLSAMANEPVPVSLLPRVRARLEARASSRKWLFQVLTASAVAAVILLAVYVPRGTKRPPSVAVKEVPATRQEAPTPPELRLDQIAVSVAAPRREPRVAHKKTGRLPDTTQTTAGSGVIVLGEEREAFARFVAELPEKRDVAMALTRPAPQSKAQALEISPLQVIGLEIALLDPDTGDENLN